MVRAVQVLVLVTIVHRAGVLAHAQVIIVQAVHPLVRATVLLAEVQVRVLVQAIAAGPAVLLQEVLTAQAHLHQAVHLAAAEEDAVADAADKIQ